MAKMAKMDQCSLSVCTEILWHEGTMGIASSLSDNEFTRTSGLEPKPWRETFKTLGSLLEIGWMLAAHE
jgi:hypothetical protein